MADTHDDVNKRLSQWVISLAITIVCCAIFFLVFAGYFLRVQERLIEMQVRVELNESRIAALENNYMFAMQQRAAPPPAPVVMHRQPDIAAPAPAMPPEPSPVPKAAAPANPVVPSNEALLLDTKVAPPPVAAPAEPVAAEKAPAKPAHHKPAKPKAESKAKE